jgi:hypothetical protein
MLGDGALNEHPRRMICYITPGTPTTPHMPNASVLPSSTNTATRASARVLKGRPAALVALQAVPAGSAAGLLVAKMDQLSRSVVDGAILSSGLRESAGRCTSQTSTSTPARRLER